MEYTEKVLEKFLIDLHSHILPGLDDGAKTGEISRRMLAMAAAEGTDLIYATPHLVSGVWEPRWEEIAAGAARLNSWAEEQGLGIRVRPGAEVAADPSMLGRIRPGCYTLGESRYVLVELPAHCLPDYLDDFFFQLMTRELTPVIAHPERHADLRRRPELLAEWVERGICLQVNSGSLSGRMGPHAAAGAAMIAGRGLLHALGSDTHSTGHRRPDLRSGMNALAALDAQTLELITGSAGLPRAIAEDRPFSPRPPRPAPEETPPRSSFWTRLRSVVAGGSR